MQINFPRKIRAKKKMTTINGFHIIIIIYSIQVIIKQSWKSYHLVTSPVPASLFTDTGEARYYKGKSTLKKKLKVKVSTRTNDADVIF